MPTGSPISASVTKTRSPDQPGPLEDITDRRSRRPAGLGSLTLQDHPQLARSQMWEGSSLYGGSYPFIQTGDVANANGHISSYSQTYSELGLAQSRMWPAGTLCITIAANIAKTAVLTFPACFPDSVVGFIPGDQVLRDFVRYWFLTIQSRLEEEAPQAAQKNINLRILGELVSVLKLVESLESL
jgi:Type I restriction modification DNA specificity domain